jgi:ABC-type transport system involved in multi-copper enzyme maturation permease subunit
MWSLLTVALLAGNSIAGERADRSAEFVAYLPLPRWRMLASKLLLHLIALIVLSAVNLLTFKRLAELGELGNESALLVGCYFGLSLAIYGVGWLVSSLQSSPALATMTGLATPGLIAMCIWGLGEMTEDPFSDRIFVVWCATIWLAVAIACFSVGTWYYLRRSEP